MCKAEEIQSDCVSAGTWCAMQVEDAVRAVAAKNNRPDPLLTGSRPLKMRYKPDKVARLCMLNVLDAVFEMQLRLPCLRDMHQRLSWSRWIEDLGLTYPTTRRHARLTQRVLALQEQQRRSSPGHPPPSHSSPGFAPPRGGSPQVGHIAETPLSGALHPTCMCYCGRAL